MLLLCPRPADAVSLIRDAVAKSLPCGPAVAGVEVTASGAVPRGEAWVYVDGRVRVMRIVNLG